MNLAARIRRLERARGARRVDDSELGRYLREETRIMNECRAAARELFALMWEEAGYPERATAMRATTTYGDFSRQVDVFYETARKDARVAAVEAECRAAAIEHLAAQSPRLRCKDDDGSLSAWSGKK